MHEGVPIAKDQGVFPAVMTGFDSNFGKVPMLSDEEYSEQLRQTYKNAADRAAARPSSHLVSMLRISL